MATNRPRDRASAQQLLDKIRKQNGYVGADKFREGIPDPIFRREVEEAFMLQHQLIGPSIIRLAKNLYTSKAHFVIELLRNADDNSYGEAIASGNAPYVSFHVYPERVVMECNEDGFNEDNLKAICATGRSSKPASGQPSTREKGIGFKSVFTVAWKAHIQSGGLSFSFQHQSKDSGLGMISPSWEVPDEGLDPRITRTTLHLHKNGAVETKKDVRAAIKDQFSDIPETILLFMKNLKRIHVAYYSENGQQISSENYTIDSTKTPNHAVLTKSSTAHDGSVTKQTKLFHMTTYQATNLTKIDSKEHAEEEEKPCTYSEPQIVLAFPLSETLLPLVEAQKVFAFLPVRPVGFNFIIHADFVIDENREDIIQDNLFNHSLLDGIVEAFVQAVLQFCLHETLRYQWMRYLPGRNEKSWSPLWLSLICKIDARLGHEAVLYSRNSCDLRGITELVRLPSSFVDRDGEPLFDEGDSKIIISQKYKKEDLKILRQYGLEYVGMGSVLEWLQNDLRSCFSSRMKSPNTNEGWHTQVANFLNSILSRGSFTKYPEMMKKIDLIPLQDGSWVSASSGPIYFAKHGDVEVPSDINLRVVSRSVTNQERLAFFSSLGVQRAPVKLVRSQILGKYTNIDSTSILSVQASKRHLNFLYRSEHLKDPSEPDYSNLKIFDHDGHWGSAFEVNLYIANDEAYGPRVLTRRTAPGSNPGAGAPGCGLFFVNNEYFKDPIPCSQKHELTWSDWFYEKLAVSRYLDFSVDEGELSYDVAYLQKHRPDKFLGALCIWYRDSQAIPSDLAEHLRETEVLVRDNRFALLKDAYFPTEELERTVERFVGPDVFFPWLQLDTETTGPTSQFPWMELMKELKVGTPKTELDFALDMLKYVLDALQNQSLSPSMSKLVDLYHHIQSKYLESGDRSEAAEKIRYKKCIYTPHAERGCDWAYSSDCVWRSQHNMKTKFPLERLYGSLLPSGVTRGSSLAILFKTILKIPDCTWETYVDELKSLRNSGCEDSDLIMDIYEALRRIRSKSITFPNEAFEDNNLIYLPTGSGKDWHKVSECVWSGAVTLRTGVSLDKAYQQLEDLFVWFLDVRLVTLSMAIEELKEAGSRAQVSERDVIESIWAVNSLLITERNPPNPKELVELNIFPVKHPNGSVTCASAATDFFVPDRESLRTAFSRKVKFLSFKLEEVVRLQPFLEWTQMNQRYVSNHASSITSFDGKEAILITNVNRQIRNRAHALLRIAVHFESPRAGSSSAVERLYEVLKDSEIYETEGIICKAILSQDGHSHEVKVNRPSVCVDGDESSLKIYLPRNKDEQDYAFTNKLGRWLFAWIMGHLPTQAPRGLSWSGVKATRTVLLAPLRMLPTALEDFGIVAIDVANRDEVEQFESLLTEPPQEDSPEDYDGLTTNGDGSTTDIVGTASFPTTEASENTSIIVASGNWEIQANSTGPLIAAPGQQVDLATRPLPSTPFQQPQLIEPNSQNVDLMEKIIELRRSRALLDLEEANLMQACIMRGRPKEISE
ncbi:hypothetical protein BGZ63DRAFT_364030 [Mariannaea sp. PMI_226]|nr:hypothetical protein BGZ63DRAFT_364030 [Mariannaea sp. PMI_226]